jgi:hypothetical protein
MDNSKNFILIRLNCKNKNEDKKGKKGIQNEDTDSDMIAILTDVFTLSSFKMKKVKQHLMNKYLSWKRI